MGELFGVERRLRGGEQQASAEIMTSLLRALFVRDHVDEVTAGELARAIRLRKGAGRPAESYRYQEDLEHVLRHANSVAHRADEPSTPA
jgi:predicted ArsR family transcriptional regulator